MKTQYEKGEYDEVRKYGVEWYFLGDEFFYGSSLALPLKKRKGRSKATFYVTLHNSFQGYLCRTALRL
ncbi:MAG: hypothetical protein UHY58_06335, partial [Alistipes sp.]|nr:hypothetical protein [Alistipes sp.]